MGEGKHERCEYVGLFPLNVVVQDEKNQVMKTNVWLRMVSLGNGRVFRRQNVSFRLSCERYLSAAFETVKTRLHDTTGCETGCTTGLTTGCIV